MPLLLIGALGIAAIGGSALFSYEAGQEAGQGLKEALVIIGVATGVGIIIYALHKSGKNI